MSERDTNDQPRYQPDPILRRGRAATMWVWVIGCVVLAVIALTLVVTNYNTSSAPQTSGHYRGPPSTTGASVPPSSALPAGRNTSAAPPTNTHENPVR